MGHWPVLSIVVILRNEDERLLRYLRSAVPGAPIGGPIEVIDSASTDRSAARAAQSGVRVISVAPARACAAAR
jgi:glycosyltransferase involved in cell wall biosynthesis